MSAAMGDMREVHTIINAQFPRSGRVRTGLRWEGATAGDPKTRRTRVTTPGTSSQIAKKTQCKAVLNMGARETGCKQETIEETHAIKPRDTLCIVSKFVRDVPSIDLTPLELTVVGWF